MRVEENLKRLGMAVPNLEELWRVNASGAHYISHFPVKGLLYLCGTTPVRDACLDDGSLTRHRNALRCTRHPEPGRSTCEV